MLSSGYSSNFATFPSVGHVHPGFTDRDQLPKSTSSPSLVTFPFLTKTNQGNRAVPSSDIRDAKSDNDRECPSACDRPGSSRHSETLLVRSLLIVGRKASRHPPNNNNLMLEGIKPGPRASFGRSITKTPPTVVRPPSLPNSLVAKGNREAALRERGLLPPLTPDHSVSRIGGIGPTDPHQPNTDTPASRIKQEWEARKVMSTSPSHEPSSNVTEFVVENGTTDTTMEPVSVTQEPSAITPFVQQFDTTAKPSPLNLVADGDVSPTPDTSNGDGRPTDKPQQPVSSAQALPTIAIIPATPAVLPSPKDIGTSSPLTADPNVSVGSPTMSSHIKSSTLPSVSESDSGISMSSTAVDENTHHSNETDASPQLIIPHTSGDFATGLDKILESPMEEGGPDAEANTVPSVTEKVQDPARRRQRAKTDSGLQPERRRSIMVFFSKREKPQRSASEHAPSSEAEEATPSPGPRRGGLLQSIIGSISRKRPSVKITTPSVQARAKSVNVTARPTLPASPTSPTSPTSPKSPTSTTSSQTYGRGALAPTMHNRGTITTSANELQDDESRRVCEIHFLT